MYGLQVMDSWLYDDKHPFIHIEAGDTFRSLREKVDSDYFEQLIRDCLISNSHRSVLCLVPRRGLAEEQEKELAEKLASYKESLDEEQIRAIVENTRALRIYQEISEKKRSR